MKDSEKFFLWVALFLALTNSFAIYLLYENHRILDLNHDELKEEVEKINKSIDEFEVVTNKRLNQITGYTNDNANRLTLEVKRNSENFKKAHGNFQTLNDRFDKNDKNMRRFKSLIVCTAKDGGSSLTPNVEDYNKNKEEWDELYSCE